VRAAGASVSTGNLYLAYAKWAGENGEFPISKRAFGLRMAERGYERRKSNGIRIYKGIGLLADGVQKQIAIEP
jgi:putative DNA primase/helicase